MKDFKSSLNALQEKLNQPKEEIKAKDTPKDTDRLNYDLASITDVILEKGVYLAVYNGVDPLTLNDPFSQIQPSQDYLEDLYLKKHRSQDYLELIRDEKTHKSASYTLKTTEKYLDFIRALAFVKNVSVKDLIINAIDDSITDQERENALAIIDKYIKR